MKSKKIPQCVYKKTIIFYVLNKWRPPSLSELTPYELELELDLGSEASKYY